MPEGDTIHRAAATLRPVLQDAVLQEFWARKLRGARPRAGETIGRVDAVGKHLLMEFSGGLTLETHMRMAGSWHLYRAGDRWRKPEHLARVRLEVEGWQAVCFSAPEVRTFATGTSDPTPVSGLGPDLCDPDIDLPAVLDVALQRWEELADPNTEVGDVLLDQRVAAGIGNVYKSEACHAIGITPYTRSADVPENKRRDLLAIASRQLRRNLTTNARVTVAGGLAVYGRNRRPCRVCATPVNLGRQGVDQRVTYWCPQCQPKFAR